MTNQTDYYNRFIVDEFRKSLEVGKLRNFSLNYRPKLSILI